MVFVGPFQLGKFYDSMKICGEFLPSIFLLLENGASMETALQYQRHFLAQGLVFSSRDSHKHQLRASEQHPKCKDLPPVAAPAWSGRFPPWIAAPSGREPERPENAGGRQEGWEHTRAATEMGTAVS